MEPPRTQRYEIEGCIGVGGVGEVFRARDNRLGRAVALKRLLPEPGAPAGQTYAQALREASHLAALQHPHIVSVYDVGEDERGPYLVMELVEGDTLEEAVERGPFPLGDFLLLARQSLDALAAAHRVGLMHRDLKPGNVMLKHGVAGESFEVKLLDFGLSGFTGRRGNGEAAAATENAGDDSVVGSVHFMAPEQFTRERPPDARTDLYALGCLFYYALTATYPVEGDTVGTVVERHLKGDVPRLAPRRPEVPDALCAWVMRLLSIRPEERPESAAHALEELQGLRETAFDPARATSVPSLSRRLATRRTARLHLPEVASVVVREIGGVGGGRWPAFLAPLKVSPWRLAAVALAVGAFLGITVGGSVRGGDSRPAATLSAWPPATATDRRRPEQPPAPAVVVAATDHATLRAHLGAEIVAEGRLLALDSRPNRAVRSLRFEPGTDGVALALVFFGGEKAASPPSSSTPSDASLQAYVGHRVRARGRLSEFRGALQVIVRDPAQIEAVY